MERNSAFEFKLVSLAWLRAEQQGDQLMARVAIVTGGTRGIGEAVCRALKDQGFVVAANYGGHMRKRCKFTTGIKKNIVLVDVLVFFLFLSVFLFKDASLVARDEVIS